MTGMAMMVAGWILMQIWHALYLFGKALFRLTERLHGVWTRLYFGGKRRRQR